MPMTYAEHERKLKAPAVCDVAASEGSTQRRQHYGSHQRRICRGL